jgi:uncharacterized protein (DUF342 family)
MEQQQLFAPNINDGGFNVTISKDAMTVWGEFTPARGIGRPVGQEQINAVLAAYQIVHGIQIKTIQKAVSECAKTKAALKMVLVAQGTEPVAEVQPYMEILSEFDPGKKNGIREGAQGQIDFRQFSPFTIVRQYEYLAARRPGNPGKNGRNVYGEEMPFTVAPAKGIQAGKNICVEQNGCFAAVHGQLLLTGDVLNVDETLVIQGSVGYKTGHIDFPGDIIIHGFVNDGFRLYSGGTITCKQTLDVTDVSAKRGLIVNGGVIGRLESTIKVGDDVDVRFMDHCNFFSDGNITVRAEIIRSTVHTKGRVTLGQDSSIIDSTIHSFHSISAAAITNSTGSRSALCLGMDFDLRDAVNESRLRLDDLTKKSDQANRQFAQAPDNRRQDLRNASVLADARRLLEEKKLEKLLAQFYVDPKAELQVNGKIAQGTRIEICGAFLVVPCDMKEMTFRLSESGKSIIMDADAIKEAAKQRTKLLFGRRRNNQNTQ